MNLVQTADEILDHLRLAVEPTEAIQQALQSIEALAQKELSATPDKLKALNARRVLGSNSLAKGQSLAEWEQANHWLGLQIQQGQTQEFSTLQSLNQILTNSASSLRDFSIYSGDMEYLPVSYLSEGLAIWQQKLKSIDHPLLRAFESYLAVVTLHPFANGNGRTARLSGDWELIQQGFLPVCFDSPIQSHVAVMLNQKPRNKEKSFLKFLAAVEQSYSILFD